MFTLEAYPADIKIMVWICSLISSLFFFCVFFFFSSKKWSSAISMTFVTYNKLPPAAMMFHSIHNSTSFQLVYAEDGVSLLKIQDHFNLKVPVEALSGSSLHKPELVPHLPREKWNKIEEKHLQRNP